MKKLNSGMTLVEVLVSVAVFGTMTMAITMAFAAAFKYNSRNIRRDYELNLQQTAVEKGTAAGVEIFENSYKARTLNYVDSSGTTKYSISDVTEYNAVKSAQNGDEYNFEIKTFTSKSLGSTKVTYNAHPTADATTGITPTPSYKLSFSNLSTLPVDVKIETVGGTIYEGDSASGYRHSSSLYKRSIAAIGATDIITEDGETTAPSGFEVGFEKETLSNDTLKVTIYTNGTIAWCNYLSPTDLTSITKNGEFNVVVEATGNVKATYS